jgi:hypothetical protein
MKVQLMYVARVAVLLLLPIAGCARHTPEPVSQPQSVAEQPAAPQVAAEPKEPATPQPAPAAVPAPSATTPTPRATTPAPNPPATPQPAPAATPAPTATTPAPKPGSKPAAPAARTPARAPAPDARAPKPAAPPVAAPPAPVTTLDLAALKEQLKATKAIGVFTKISLKNQVDDLMDRFRDYYMGKAKITMPELRRSYDLLMMKVLSLLQDSDQNLASKIVSSREAIWALLSDPKKFATLQT